MRSDLTKLRQSLFNLLSNACKFTENGKVTLRAREEGPEWLSFEVADDGIGMTPEQLSRLFQAFSQADDSTSRKYGGTGLGLMLTRNFCRMLGGDVSVLSKAGEGTTFTIRLPRYTQEAVSLQDERPPARTGGRRVLVIDDNADARELLARSLEKAGYEVRVASSGEEGLVAARELQPDLITLDVMMPGLDGPHVLSQLRSEPALAEIPVLLVSTRADREMALTLGASGFLTKPVDREELLRVVNRLAPAAKSCLVVDDDPMQRQLLVRYLEGWDVREAPDGLAALGLLRSRKADLILLDLVMPRMDGFELQRMLRASGDKALASIPIIVISSKDLTPEEIQELEGAERPVLRKGFQPEELVRLMESMFPGKDDDERA
jgi:CheY-like chemotaxis protein